MRESTELRPSRLGFFIPLLITAMFTAGHIRGEQVLALTGSILLIVSAYSLLAVLLSALINRKKARSLSARISGGAVNAGGRGEALLVREPAGGNYRFFRLPAVLIRYEINLASKDGRSIRRVFDPGILKNGSCSFSVPGRGAYFDGGDRLNISDALGLFRFSFLKKPEEGPRLLAAPRLPEEAIPLNPRYGGAGQRRESGFRRTDDLIDHRPYIPGDDPRRINWKLYGHAGDLFVREGEPEPPPHSRLTIMVDTQVDRTLFTVEAGRRGLDLLCENALAAALEYTARGMDVQIGYTGGVLREGSPGELAAALAWPAVLALAGPAAGRRNPPPDFPPVPEDRGILILALPRSASDPGALDRYLKKRTAAQGPDLLFLYREEALDGPAETCAALYGQKSGVRARRFRA